MELKRKFEPNLNIDDQQWPESPDIFDMLDDSWVQEEKRRQNAIMQKVINDTTMHLKACDDAIKMYETFIASANCDEDRELRIDMVGPALRKNENRKHHYLVSLLEFHIPI